MGFGGGDQYGDKSGIGYGFEHKNKSEVTGGNKRAIGVNSETSEIFENQVWLNSEDAAIYLCRSVGQLRNMVYRRQIKPRKYVGRLYFRKSELDRVVESSNKRGF